MQEVFECFFNDRACLTGKTFGFVTHYQGKILASGC